MFWLNKLLIDANKKTETSFIKDNANRGNFIRQNGKNGNLIVVLNIS